MCNASWVSVRLASAGLCVLAALCVGTGPARADGDPASDVLFGRTVFLPIAAPVSPPLAARLVAATKAAGKVGEPVRVALIAAPGDLGAVPGLFGKPAEYARFLGLELQFVYSGRLLVVMPQGLALSRKGRLLTSPAAAKASIGAGADGLARAALAVIEQPVHPATHATPRPQGVAQPPGRRRAAVAAPSSASRSVDVWKATAVAIGAVAGLLLAGALGVRRRRRRLRLVEPVVFTPPDPNDPYAYRNRW